jgi:hypothetical protein
VPIKENKKYKKEEKFSFLIVKDRELLKRKQAETGPSVPN